MKKPKLILSLILILVGIVVFAIMAFLIQRNFALNGFRQGNTYGEYFKEEALNIHDFGGMTIISIACVSLGLFFGLLPELIVWFRRIDKGFVKKYTGRFTRWGKTKKVKQIVLAGAIVFLICICAFGIWLSAKDQIAFDQVVTMVKQYNTDRESIKKYDIFKKLEQLGITESARACAIDREFIQDYMKRKSPEKFIKSFILVDEFMNSYGYRAGECPDNVTTQYCARNKCEKVLRTALELGEYAPISIQLADKNAPGYYSENAKDYPTFTEDRAERKYNYGPDNEVGHEYKPYYVEITYYGDYAIYHAYGNRETGGFYGWRNGVFYDEQSHWEYYDYYYLAYKGNRISDYYNSAEELLQNVKDMEIFIIDGKAYYFSAEKKCGYANHTYQAWQRFYAMDLDES